MKVTQLIIGHYRSVAASNVLSHMLYALGEDGSMWKMLGGQWTRLPDLPGQKPGAEPRLSLNRDDGSPSPRKGRIKARMPENPALIDRGDGKGFVENDENDDDVIS